MNAFLSKEEEKPLITCKECKTRECIATGKICKAVEALLPKPRSGGHRKEFPTDNIDGLVTQWAFNRKGRRKAPKTYNNDWEIE